MLHLNNAGAALMPEPVLDAMHAQIDREATMGGYEAAEAIEGQLDGTYALDRPPARRASASEIAFAESATACVGRWPSTRCRSAPATAS